MCAKATDDKEAMRLSQLQYHRYAAHTVLPTCTMRRYILILAQHKPDNRCIAGRAGLLTGYYRLSSSLEEELQTGPLSNVVPINMRVLDIARSVIKTISSTAIVLHASDIHWIGVSYLTNL